MFCVDAIDIGCEPDRGPIFHHTLQAYETRKKGPERTLWQAWGFTSGVLARWWSGCSFCGRLGVFEQHHGWRI